MGQFLRINGDYNIKVNAGSTITLDTGPASSGGEVRVTGNLIVEGDTTTVQAENLNVEDNIIIVNYYGDDRTNLPAGVTLNYAGIQIDRGSEDPVGLFYDEVNDSWLFVSGGPAVTDKDLATPFNYSTSRIKIKEILTDASTDFGDLTLIGTGTGLVKVSGTTEYEQEILDRELASPGSMDDVLTNKKYVDDAIQNNPTFQIVAPQFQDTKVIIADKEILPTLTNPIPPGSLEYFNSTTDFSTFGESAVSIITDNSLTAQFYSSRVEIFDLELTRSEISTRAGITNENIIIRTQGTGKLQTNYALQLEQLSTVPAYTANSTILYAASPSIGTTGVWFTNDSTEVSKRNGELISKNKALVFSMIF